VVALNDERSWYRYHHLFAQALRHHLQQREPMLLSELHRRASAWYEQHYLSAEAVQHALAIPDAELAARLIEPIALPVTLYGQIYTVLGRMNDLPEALMHTRPFLCMYHAQLLTLTNQLEEAGTRLQEAEQGVQEEVSASQAQIIMGWVLDIRADIALFSGDIPQALSLAQQAFALYPSLRR
jgi:LuxR family maltose regulon positive regulatory protein